VTATQTWRTAAIAALLVSMSGCGTSVSQTLAGREQVTVAAAANLTEVFQQIGSRFETRTGIHPVFSFASTAQLTQQIENSAPFDVIAAADAEHVAQLDREHLLVSGSRATYAVGKLALWIPPKSQAMVSRIDDLASPGVRVIAVAKPELAPYGQATVDTLHHLGLWDKVAPKIVYAENISMAKQYGGSNNADAVFTAYSLVIHEGGKVLPVDEKLHAPLTQDLAIVANSSHREAARRFVGFVMGEAGRDILRSYGYK